MFDFLIQAWNFVLPYLQFIWAIIFSIWWIILPFFAFKFINFAYLVYMQTKWFESHGNFVLLEIKFPREIKKPLKAMEDVFSVIWATFYDPANVKEKFFEGKFLLGASLEIASIEGFPHFYIRVPSGVKTHIEADIHAHYPGVELFEVSDYTKNVPMDVPNKDWDLWGANYMPMKEDVYPIKTYRKFYEENPEIKDEEKRIDPISNLVENMSKIGKGEQLWFQILISSADDDNNDYVKRGKALVNKLVKRPGPKKNKSLFGDFIDILFGNYGEAKDEKAALLPPEMLLTPGEREIVAAIEEKISKVGFNCSLRSFYLAKRENFFGTNKLAPIIYMNQFQAKNLNAIVPWKPTMTKIQSPDFLQKRRVYLRKRDLFLKYVNRSIPFEPYAGGTFFLNIEELATLWHFPGRDVAPTTKLERINVKKAPPPSTLPVEE